MQAEIKEKQGKFDMDDLKILIDQNNKIVEHMSQTIEDFTHFFQLDNQKESWFDPAETCCESLGIIGGTLQSNDITLHQIFPKLPQKIYGHPRAFSHVILILLSNANDVLKRKNIEEAIIWIEIAIGNEYLTITVEDNGGGIEEDIISRVFDPYFSTKIKEEGTGIGLYYHTTYFLWHDYGVQ